MPVRLTQALAEVVASAGEAVLSQAVRERATMAFLDTIGVMIAGGGEDSVSLLLRTIGGTRGEAEASILLGARRCDIRAAACINATSAHALDFDDVAFGGHLSAVVVPAALVAAENARCGGVALLRAYLAGYEAWSEISSRVSPLYHARGLHPTGLLGPIAAAATCASIYGLDARRTAMALSLGASQAAGLLANFGTHAKPFHAGRAAEAGLFAAHLVANGYSAAPDALEGSGGFMAAYSNPGEYDLDRPLGFEREGWRLDRSQPSVKRYPVCYAAHRSIDAALELREQVSADLEDVQTIRVTISARHSSILRHRMPSTVNEARFSIEFAVACALSRGWVGLSELSLETVQSPQVRRLMELTERDTEVPADAFLDGFAEADRVVVELSDGRVLAGRPVTRAIGHADRPAGRDAIAAKFFDCMRQAGREEQAQRLFRQLSHIEDMADCRSFAQD